MDLPKKLTPAQVAELRRLVQERQPTFGKDRARVQRNLVNVRLARFVSTAGEPMEAEFADLCEATEAGREALANHKPCEACEKTLREPGLPWCARCARRDSKARSR